MEKPVRATKQKTKRPKQTKKDIATANKLELPPLCRYQKYAETPNSRVASCDLLPSPYNKLVRAIDTVARHKLTEEVRTGLVNRPVYNRRTRHIVGGHQRIDVIRELMGPCGDCMANEARLLPLWRAIRSGEKPYSLDSWIDPAVPNENPNVCPSCRGTGTRLFSLDVDIIDVDLVEEKVRNLKLNNHALQGHFEGEGLTEILTDIGHSGVSFERAGFDVVNLELSGVSPEIWLTREDNPEVVKPIVEDADKIAEFRRLRRERTERVRQQGQEQADRVVLIQFESSDDRGLFLERLGIRRDDPAGGTIQGWRVLTALNLQKQ